MAAKGEVNASGQPGNITLPLTDTMEARPTDEVVFGGNLPADKKYIDNVKAEKDKSNPDNAFARSQVLRVYDDKGNPHSVLMKFVRTDYETDGTGSEWGVAFYDYEALKQVSKGQEETARIKLYDKDGKEQKDANFGPNGKAIIKDMLKLSFDSQGQLSKDDKIKLKNLKFQINKFTIKDTGGTKSCEFSTNTAEILTKQKINLDMSKLTGFGGVNNFGVEQSNGNAAGTLTGFGVEADGTIRGTFSNGDSRALAKIATASFSNPLGLEKAGASYFVESGNSGQPQIGEPGSGSRGAMTGGAIEMSNVDLAAEFTNLILSQRGFQANTRVITTSDEILQELVSMKR